MCGDIQQLIHNHFVTVLQYNLTFHSETYFFNNTLSNTIKSNMQIKT